MRKCVLTWEKKEQGFYKASSCELCSIIIQLKILITDGEMGIGYRNLVWPVGVLVLPGKIISPRPAGGEGTI